jgi:hypothetical protein
VAIFEVVVRKVGDGESLTWGEKWQFKERKEEREAMWAKRQGRTQGRGETGTRRSLGGAWGLLDGKQKTLGVRGGARTSMNAVK